MGNTDSGKFSTSGRGFPDVAAAGVAFNIVVDGRVEQVEGTSCASPTFASVIGLLNDELLSHGQAPLGFLNPWLYSDAASALNDITSGDNPGCFTNGFPATKGWDAVRSSPIIVNFPVIVFVLMRCDLGHWSWYPQLPQPSLCARLVERQSHDVSISHSVRSFLEQNVQLACRLHICTTYAIVYTIGISPSTYQCPLGLGVARPIVDVQQII